MIVRAAIGVFVLSFVFDVVCLISGHIDPWATIAFYTMVGGIVGALVAAAFGAIDLMSLPDGPVLRIGYAHMGINFAVILVFGLDAWLRLPQDSIGGLPFALSV